MCQGFCWGRCRPTRESICLKLLKHTIFLTFSSTRIQFLRHIRDFFGTVFKMENEVKDEEDLRVGTDKVLMTCVGAGYTNLSKTMT